MQNKEFITSDTHFNHFKSIKYSNRPFTSVEEMDEKLIKNWNNVVGKSHRVFHLGDFAFANKEKIANIVSRLNGYIILIMGNHDKRHKSSWFLDAGFNEVYNWPIVYNKKYILSHEPVYVDENMPYVNIHGHLHQNEVTDLNGNKNEYYANVCVEKTNYTPVLLSDILKKF